MKPVRIDLHCHTAISDGTDSPTELVEAARAAGLDVVAITDHDTTAGWAEACSALPTGMGLVRGMELSCAAVSATGRPIPVHLLGYLFDPAYPPLAAELERLQGERVRRVRTMAERMAADGLPIDPVAVLADAGPSVGRPHLGRALVQAGVVPSVDAAFGNLLSSRGGYYVHKEDVPVQRGLELFAAAGGVSVLAHPRAHVRGGTLTEDDIAGLVPLGLGGLEVDHLDHSAADRVRLGELAGQLGLLRTGSSDYHGHNKSVRLGADTTAVEEFERLLGEAKATGLVQG